MIPIDKRDCVHRGQASEEFTLVICVGRFWPAHGGAERYALDIAEWFSRICPVIVITAVRHSSRPLTAQLLSSDGSYLEYGIGSENGCVYTVGLRKIARLWFRGLCLLEKTIVQVASSTYYGTRWLAMREISRLLAQDVSKIFDIPSTRNVVVHAMGTWELALVGDRLFPHSVHVATPFIHPGHWGEDSFTQRWLRHRHGLIALSELDALACRRTGIQSDRVHLVPLFGPQIHESPFRREERRVVVFLGTARPYKGVDIFIEVASSLGAPRTDLEFIWIGDVPSDTEHLIAVARASGVQVKGAVTESEKLDVLRRAMCLCLPSTSEITPYSILEAWAAGAPVVATDDPYLREFVGEAGGLVTRDASAFVAAILRLKEQPELAERQVRLGRTYLDSRHHPSTIGSRLLSAYRRALNHQQEEAPLNG
jgi:glycosyltransferase involved in cell wall biosynthesis